MNIHEFIFWKYIRAENEVFKRRNVEVHNMPSMLADNRTKPKSCHVDRRFKVKIKYSMRRKDCSLKLPKLC